MKTYLGLFLCILLLSCSGQLTDNTSSGALENTSPVVDNTTASPHDNSHPAESAESFTGLSIVSFNIQFLGSFKKRDNAALADLLKDHDVVVVQELVAPPVDGSYPDGEPYSADNESVAFFDAMSRQGFEYMLSPEDTGSGDDIHKNSTSTEWWVAFYKPERVELALNLPHGFLAEDRSNNPDYERVPFAFPFRNLSGGEDFVLISVHLQPGGSSDDKARRNHELSSIASWIDENDDQEKDFIILGDMNIENAEELSASTPAGFISLNDEMRRTNTLINDTSTHGAKPYDHVMYRPENTGNEVDVAFDLIVINLIEAMRPKWTSSDSYPGDPYDHNLFKQYYSDHHPVEFRMIGIRDDD